VNSPRTPLAAFVAIIAVMAFASSAGASVKTTPYGGTTDARPGGHGTLTTGVKYEYGNTSETVKRILIDTPAGGIGNPNAVPLADRCTKKTFETSTCNAKSQVGVVTISATAYLGIIPIPMNDMTGTISEIQTDSEVPTLVGAYIQPAIGDPIRAYARYYPVTSGPDGDFRIRTETDPFPTTAKALGLDLPIQITKYEQKLFGKLPSNGRPFITNPGRCDTWNSGGYAEFYRATGTPDSDPFGTGTKTYFKSANVPTQPDCRTEAPFNAGADAKVETPGRGEHAALTTDLTIGGLDADPQGSAISRTVTVTTPRAVTVDVAQLGRICSNEDFDAFRCPASTQVGTTSIATPMISAGLQGEVFLVKASAGHNLPDLGIHVHGAIEFNVRGTTRFVNGSQLETTFDGLPQAGFSSFRLNLAGGPNGLLLVRRCPTDGSDPADGGPTHFRLTSFQGQVREFDSATSFAPGSCLNYSLKVKGLGRCVKKRSLVFTPSIKPRDEVSGVKVYIGRRLVKTYAGSPAKIRVKLSNRLRAGQSVRVKLKVQFKPGAKYPSGQVITKTVRIRLCR
jgi:hypothetical protein